MMNVAGLAVAISDRACLDVLHASAAGLSGRPNVTLEMEQAITVNINAMVQFYSSTYASRYAIKTRNSEKLYSEKGTHCFQHNR